MSATLAEPATTYNRTTQIIHWVSALLILIMIGLGLTMTRIDSGEVQQNLYSAHVTLGLVVLVLTAFRLIWLVFNRWPPPPPGLSSLQEKLMTWTHILLYPLLILMVTSGVGMLLLSDITPSPVGIRPSDIEDVPPREAHILLSKVFIVLLIIHLRGVLGYQLRKGDTMARMGVRWFG